MFGLILAFPVSQIIGDSEAIIEGLTPTKFKLVKNNSTLYRSDRDAPLCKYFCPCQVRMWSKVAGKSDRLKN